MNVKVVTAKKEGAPLLSGTGIPQNIKFVMGVVLILLIVAGIVLLFVVGKGVFYGKALEIPSIPPPEPIASTWFDFSLGPQGMGRFTYLAMPYILYAPDPSSLDPLVNGALCYCAKGSCPDFNSCVASMKNPVEGATKGEVIYYTFVTYENICYTAEVKYRVDYTDPNNPRSRVAADVYLCSGQAVPDEDRDGVGDLADQCLSTPAGASVDPTTGCSSESKCDNQIDDDGDGKIDCVDSDCYGFEVCSPSIGPPPVPICTDTDNDGYCAESPPPGECALQSDGTYSCPPASPPESKLGWSDCDVTDPLKYILLQQLPDPDGDRVPNSGVYISECGTGQTRVGYVAVGDSVSACPRNDPRYPECIDNCPTVANPNQEDSDRDGIGDACEIPPAGETTPGDVSGDHSVDSTDVSYLLYVLRAQSEGCGASTAIVCDYSGDGLFVCQNGLVHVMIDENDRAHANDICPAGSVYGDVNNDGVVDSTDVSYLLYVLRAQSEGCGASTAIVCDYSSDGLFVCQNGQVYVMANENDRVHANDICS